MAELSLIGIELNNDSALIVGDGKEERVYYLNEDGSNLQDKSFSGYNWSNNQDTVVTADINAGYNAMRSIHLVKPYNLNPENIKSGIEIGGIIGTYKIVEEIRDLTNTTWIFNEEVNVSDLVGAVSAYSNRNYNINFITDDDKGEFEHIYLESTHAYGDTFKYGNGLRLSKYISVYDSHSGWNQMNQRWRSIRITGGSDATNKYLIAWLLTNAVRV